MYRREGLTGAVAALPSGVVSTSGVMARDSLVGARVAGPGQQPAAPLCLFWDVFSALYLAKQPQNEPVSYTHLDVYKRQANTPGEAEEWLSTAEEKPGSWWRDWAAWFQSYGGGERNAPKKLGNARHAPIEAAPGRYVKQRVV